MSAMWSFIDLQSGEFTGRRYGGPVEDLAANTPDGCMAVIGRWDPAEWRYDAVLGTVVPKDLNVGESFGELKARLERATLIDVAAAEVKQQRSVREALIALAAGEQAPVDAIAVLHLVDEEVAQLRLRLAAIRAADAVADLPA